MVNELWLVMVNDNQVFVNDKYKPINNHQVITSCQVIMAVNWFVTLINA